MMSAKKPYKAGKTTRLAVLALLKLSGAELPRQFEQAKMFGCGQSDSCRDNEDLEQAVALLHGALTNDEIAALIHNARSITKKEM